jgi:hypothetical protein
MEFAMQRVLFSFVTASLLSVISVSSAAAQAATTVDRANIAAVCAASSSQCQALIAREIARLKAAGLTAAELGTELAVVAAGLVDAAKSNPSLQASLGNALNTVAAAAPSPAQAASIAEVAEVVGGGGASGVDITTAIGGSPA